MTTCRHLNTDRPDPLSPEVICTDCGASSVTSPAAFSSCAEGHDYVRETTGWSLLVCSRCGHTDHPLYHSPKERGWEES